MPRNLDRRVEIAFPVLDPDLQAQIRDVLEIQLADTVKGRRILASGSSVRMPGGAGRPPCAHRIGSTRPSPTERAPPATT